MKKIAFITAGVVIAGLAIAFTQSVYGIRDSARRMACYGHLTCIAVAMHQYHEKHGHFPPAYLADKDGKPAHSWRVLLLEFLDPETFRLYDFNEPWNGPNNRQLQSKIPSCYACPSDPNNKTHFETNYFAVIGPDCVFTGDQTVTFDDIKRPRSETILVVESVGQSVHWMEPKDLHFHQMSFVLNDSQQSGISSYHRRGPSAVMVDGSKVSLTGIEPRRLQDMFLIK